MSEPPIAHDGTPPSLAQTAMGAVKLRLRRQRSPVAAEWRALALFSGISLLAALLAIAIAAWVLARQAEASAGATGAVAATAQSQARDADRLARIFAADGVEASLATLGAHLPQDARLVSVERKADGALLIVLETGDPDLLRNALASEPWFERFVERGQSVTPDGGMRVTLAGS